MYARGITRADDLLRDYITATAPDVEIIDIAASATTRSSCPRCELEGLIDLLLHVLESFPSLATSHRYQHGFSIVNWPYKLDLIRR